VKDSYIKGRLNMPTDEFVNEFTASVNFDKKLYRQDIQGSIAHATMLGKVGILSADEEQAIISGLTEIQQDIEQGNFSWSLELEDVHMNIERALVDKIGEAGKKLHTGRSRNDQVATDIRLWLREQTDVVLEKITELQKVLLDLAEREYKTIMPGFTHLQVAQPVSFGHHILAWHAMLGRDKQRFVNCRQRINQMPLGAAALAGTTFPIDRELTAKLLEFEGICENSLDAVSDRDFALEFVADSSILMTHLSRFSEEIILWMSAQFDFVVLPDEFCTGSSIMPQKKNPDVPELIRGKAARVYGNLISLLSLMKSQPLAYNKDNQEDKEPLFDTVTTITDSLHAYCKMLPDMQVNRNKTLKAAAAGFATATDLADYLVRKGLTFRDAHDVVGKVVGLAINSNKKLDELDLTELKSFSAVIEDDVFAAISLEGSVNARKHPGGTAPQQVLQAIAKARNDR